MLKAEKKFEKRIFKKKYDESKKVPGQKKI